MQSLNPAKGLLLCCVCISRIYPCVYRERSNPTGFPIAAIVDHVAAAAVVPSATNNDTPSPFLALSRGQIKSRFWVRQAFVSPAAGRSSTCEKACQPHSFSLCVCIEREGCKKGRPASYSQPDPWNFLPLLASFCAYKRRLLLLRQQFLRGEFLGVRSIRKRTAAHVIVRLLGSKFLWEFTTAKHPLAGRRRRRKLRISPFGPGETFGGITESRGQKRRGISLPPATAAKTTTKSPQHQEGEGMTPLLLLLYPHATTCEERGAKPGMVARCVVVGCSCVIHKCMEIPPFLVSSHLFVP